MQIGQHLLIADWLRSKSSALSLAQGDNARVGQVEDLAEVWGQVRGLLEVLVLLENMTTRQDD